MKDTTRGRFRVVSQLGHGALADVYLCRLVGVAGFEKEVVVKRIVAGHAADPHFVRMFLDEARVVAKLTHPNIVQVFESGVEDGAPYIAMEYIRGVNLAMVIARAHKDERVHYGHFANIVSGICDGLDYAHNALDEDGEPLGVVHRDIKPANILVSLEGVPKLLEFGMATAHGRLSHAQSGVFRESLRYMAPEQISQGQVDHRADVFGLGATLYELTTGRNPFGKESDPEVEVLDRVLSGVFDRPSQIVPNYPPELEAIVLSALEGEVHKRCPSARELRDRLQVFAAADEYASDPHQVAAWLRRLFPDSSRLNGVVPVPTGPIESPPPPPVPSPPSAPLGVHPPSALDKAPTLRPFLTAQLAAPREPLPLGPGPARPFKWAVLAALAVTAGAAAWGLWLRPAPSAAVVVAGSAQAPGVQQAARAYLDAAETLASEKRFDGARELLTKAAEIDSQEPTIKVRLARLRDQITTALAEAAATSPAEAAPTEAEAPNRITATDGRPEGTRLASLSRNAVSRRKGRARDLSAVGAGERRGRIKEVGRTSLTANKAFKGARAAARFPLVDGADQREDPPAETASPAPSLAAAAVVPVRVETPPPAPASQSPSAQPRPAVATPAPSAAPAPRPVTPLRPPAPSLPRIYVTEDGERLARVCQRVESSAISLAGLSRDFVSGITIPLRRQVRPNTPIYPAAMYYFVVREHALKRDRATAAANLASAHANGSIRQADH